MTYSETSSHAGIGLLEGKVAFITGGGRGIGAAAGKLFAREGAAVVLASRSVGELTTTVAEIRDDGGIADAVVCDLADSDSVRGAVDRVVEIHGRLDVAFNNGATVQQPGPMDVMAEDELDYLYRVNFRGQWLAMAAEVAALRATSKSGAIVNTSSVGSWRANGLLPAYGAFKRALNSLTESAAATYGPEGIRVNGVAPGTTFTAMISAWEEHTPGVVEQLNSMTPLRRGAEPGEIAEAVAWLLSERASYVTGVVLPVDGGASA